MPLIAIALETQLNGLSIKAEENPMTSADYNKELAQIITDYIKTAQVTGSATGVGNMGAPVASTITGNLQ